MLLGDVLELRHGPARDALAAAEPVMRAIGDALGSRAEVVLVPGNHDHAIVAGWLDWRGRRDVPAPLALEQRVPAERASWIAGRLAGWLAPASVEVAYPGLWLRDDVYATHGHYLDAHVPIPTLERLAVGAVARLVGRVPDPARPEDYEAVLAPVYAIGHASAQRAGGGRAPIGRRSSVAAWRRMAAGGRRSRLRGLALAGALRLAVAGVNRAGLGPFQSQVGVGDLRRTGLAAMGETARRLGLAPAHLLFGHTHRAGMLADDEPLEWRTGAATQLHNAGSWVYETAFVEPGPRRSSPYWPGGAIALDGDGPPRLERLLTDVPDSVLRPPARP